MIYGSFAFTNTFETKEDFSSFNAEEIEVSFWGIIFDKDKIYGHKSNAEIAFDLFRSNILNFAKLDGKFVILIKDKSSTYLLRDRHGVYSQIYFSKKSFSSSLLKLIETDKESYQIDELSLNSFLQIGYIPVPHTAYKDIWKIPAGNILRVDANGFEFIPYANNCDKLDLSQCKSIDDYSDHYASLHQEAIRKRIENFDNVGILLSGGYDSGCNLAALRSIYNGAINSYSIGFKGDSWSELPLAKCMSKRFETNHHEYEIDGSEILKLPTIVKELGDPFVEGGLMVNYCAMNMIDSPKPHVILGGDGSDQYFGTSGREIALRLLLEKTGMKIPLKAIYSIFNNKKYENGGKAYKIRFHLDKIFNILDGDLFGFPKYLLSDLILSNNTGNYFKSTKCDTSSFESLFNQHAAISDLDKIINQVIIFKASRMASLYDINIAFPYMDNKLFAFLQQLPTQYKCKGGNLIKMAKGEITSKYLLKYCYKPQLPTEITQKKKQGGFAPMPLFFKDDKQRSKISDFILSSSICDSYLNKIAVKVFIDKYEQESKLDNSWFWYRQNKAIQFFNLFALAIWWETYQNHKSITL